MQKILHASSQLFTGSSLLTSYPTRPRNERDPPSIHVQTRDASNPKKTIVPCHRDTQIPNELQGIPSPSSSSSILRLSPTINSSPMDSLHIPSLSLSLQLREEDNPHLYLRPHAAPPLNQREKERTDRIGLPREQKKDQTNKRIAKKQRGSLEELVREGGRWG